MRAAPPTVTLPFSKSIARQSLSRFARAREISLGVKLIILAVAVVFVISTQRRLVLVAQSEHQPNGHPHRPGQKREAGDHREGARHAGVGGQQRR